jgi:hypothetical protein
VRLFLDAHISARRIAATLRKSGHNVRSADEERAFDGWTDERLLELCAAENRIMLTLNVRDFTRLARTWAELGKHHHGCVIFVGIGQHEFGLIVRRLAAVLDTMPEASLWTDVVILVGRADTHT